MNMPSPSLLMLRLFATSWTILCAGAAYFLHVINPGSMGWLLLLLVAGGFFCGLFYPTALRPVYVAVERWLTPVGRVVSLLFLALIYFTLFTVYAQLLRLLGRDALRLRLVNQIESGWLLRERDSDPHRYYRQF